MLARPTIRMQANGAVGFSQRSPEPLARDFLAFLESLPPGPLYGVVAALAAAENVFPPVPADVAVALGAFLAGRGLMNPWVVFLTTWLANTGSGVAVYLLGRRYGRAFFAGKLGRRLLPESVLAHVEKEYARHGTWGIFVSRLLPVWRGVVMPFAGLARVSPARALLPMAAASAVYYGALIAFVVGLGTNLDVVLSVVGRVNVVLGVVALGLGIVVAVLIVRRLKQ
jgi:membrane protein DedA with SNARE-associated domain